MPSKKQQVLLSLFRQCKKDNNFVFDNDLVKQYAQFHSFGNPFDVTKIDSSDKLPEEILQEDYFVLHLGAGKHKFVKGISKWYHKFETIPNECTQLWQYERSLLNEYDTSESNILSVGMNQKIISHFLYNDSSIVPNIYLAKRTKIPSCTYTIGDERIEISTLQIEVDMTTEYRKQVTVFECKNGFRTNFAIYQLFLPCLYYHLLAKENNIDMREINACYLVREKDKDSMHSIIRMYVYTFTDVYKVDSITLVKSAEYRLSYK